MAGATTSYSFSLPTVGGDSDAWGGFLNSNWTALDGLLDGTTPIDGADLDNADIHATTADIDGGTIDATVIGATTPAAATVDTLTIAKEITEGITSISGTSPSINPATAGTIITWTLTAGVGHTPAVSMNNGEQVTLLISTSTGTITWSGVTWLNGTPTLAASAVNVVTFFKVGGTVYGSFAGNA